VLHFDDYFTSINKTKILLFLWKKKIIPLFWVLFVTTVSCSFPIDPSSLPLPSPLILPPYSATECWGTVTLSRLPANPSIFCFVFVLPHNSINGSESAACPRDFVFILLCVFSPTSETRCLGVPTTLNVGCLSIDKRRGFSTRRVQAWQRCF